MYDPQLSSAVAESLGNYVLPAMTAAYGGYKYYRGRKPVSAKTNRRRIILNTPETKINNLHINKSLAAAVNPFEVIDITAMAQGDDWAARTGRRIRGMRLWIRSVASSRNLDAFVVKSLDGTTPTASDFGAYMESGIADASKPNFKEILNLKNYRTTSAHTFRNLNLRGLLTHYSGSGSGTVARNALFLVIRNLDTGTTHTLNGEINFYFRDA